MSITVISGPATRTMVYGSDLQIFGHRGEAAADWWDPNGDGLCIWAAYQPKGAASLAASYTDLSGNGNNAGVGVAPTWDAVNGWKFNGVNQYLTTTFVAAVDQSQSYIAQFTNMTSVTGIIMGAYTAANARYSLIPSVGSANVRYCNGNQRSVAPALAAGNLAFGGTQGYRNGVADGAAIVIGLATARAAWIGGENDGAGSPGTPCAVYVQALAIYDCTLTAPQVLAVATAMAAL